MNGNEIILAGIEIPSDSPIFLAMLGVHVLAGMVCVITGIGAMLSRKRRGQHPWFGTAYYWGLAIVFASATVMSVMRWAEDYHLFMLGLLSFVAASLGRTALRRHWYSWAKLHISGMGLSYILLLTAFYVDNGRFLPLWKELPPVAYWLLPSAIGIPLIIQTLLRHPLVQHRGGSVRNGL